MSELPTTGDVRLDGEELIATQQGESSEEPSLTSQLPTWVTWALALLNAGVVALAFAIDGPVDVNWPLFAVLAALAFIGTRVTIDAGYVVADGVTPALALSAMLLSPGPAAVIATLSVLLMPEAISQIRGRYNGMSPAGIAINTVSSTLTVLIVATLYQLLPETAWVQLAGVAALYLLVEVLGSVLALSPNLLLGDFKGIKLVIGAFGPLLNVQTANAITTATVVIVFPDSPPAALVLGLLVSLSCAVLQVRVFAALDVAEQARQSTDELAAHQLEVLHTMLSALDRRDPAVAAHSRAVSSLGRRLAERMDLPTAQQQLVEVAGLLHDIGKFALSDDRRDRHVTSLEDDLTPQLGAQIIAPLSGYGPVASAIAAQAQPFGSTSASTPPMAARVVAVADAYDSMVMGSAQSRALGPHNALAHLRAQAGNRFDPAVVEQFCQMVLDEGQHLQLDGELGEELADRWRALTGALP